jgi:2-polyprenyl-3-methyl-5-hydroxy-6-metoxy-1,4-benzoquinol methylase
VDTSASCPLCDGTSTLIYSGCLDLEYFMPAASDFRRCDECGLVFMHPLPTRAELPDLYPANYHNFDPPSNPISRLLLSRYYDRQVARCRTHMPDDGSFLEIGCASGDVLERMQRAGYDDVQGIELSLEACEKAWQRGLKVFHGTLDEFETDQRFDVIFMSHVIEHVLDPVATVAKISALLRPGGVLCIETPNVGAPDARVFKKDWGLVHYPRHLYLFDRSTVVRLLERGDLHVERVSSQLNSCGWALSIQHALRRRGFDRSRRPRSRYYPALLLLFLPLNLLDVFLGGTAFMAAVARKPAG